MAGDGFASRYTWPKEISKPDSHAKEQVTKELLPAFTTEFPTHAERSLYSAIACMKFKNTFELQLSDWNQALALAMYATV